MFVTTSAYIDFRYFSIASLTLLRPHIFTSQTAYCSDPSRYIGGFCTPEICLPVGSNEVRSGVPFFPPATFSSELPGSQIYMLEPPRVRQKLDDDLKDANNAYDLERFIGHDSSSLRSSYCICDEQILVSQGKQEHQQESQPKLAPPQTEKFNKQLLNDLLQELSFFPDSEEAIVHKSIKNQPTKKRRRKNIQSASSYIGVSRNKGKWQALLLVGSRKLYLGTSESELETAIVYDRHALLNHGIKKVSSERSIT